MGTTLYKTAVTRSTNMHTTNINTSPPFLPQIMMIFGTCVFSHFIPRILPTIAKLPSALLTRWWSPMPTTPLGMSIIRFEKPDSKPDFPACRVKVLASRDYIKTARNQGTGDQYLILRQAEVAACTLSDHTKPWRIWIPVYHHPESGNEANS